MNAVVASGIRSPLAQAASIFPQTVLRQACPARRRRAQPVERGIPLALRQAQGERDALRHKHSPAHAESSTSPTDWGVGPMNPDSRCLPPGNRIPRLRCSEVVSRRLSDLHSSSRSPLQRTFPTVAGELHSPAQRPSARFIGSSSKHEHGLFQRAAQHERFALQLQRTIPFTLSKGLFPVYRQFQKPEGSRYRHPAPGRSGMAK